MIIVLQESSFQIMEKLVHFSIVFSSLLLAGVHCSQSKLNLTCPAKVEFNQQPFKCIFADMRLFAASTLTVSFGDGSENSVYVKSGK